MKGQLVGNLVLDGHRYSSEERNIAAKFQELSRLLALRLSVCKEHEVADLLECYDMAIRIGFQRLPDNEVMSLHKNRLVKAWKTKKGYVEESCVFGMISGEVKARTGCANRDFSSAYKSILENWITTLTRYDTFHGISSYEKYQRLAMIMRENLDRYVSNARELKKRWYNCNKVEDLSSLGSLILRSYFRFISSLTPSILGFEEKMMLDDRILRELSGRTDLDPHDREAFRLAIEFNTELIHLELTAAV